MAEPREVKWHREGDPKKYDFSKVQKKKKTKIRRWFPALGEKSHGTNNIVCSRASTSDTSSRSHESRQSTQSSTQSSSENQMDLVHVSQVMNIK